MNPVIKGFSQVMCELLLDHFNGVFTSTNSNKFINNPIIFFSVNKMTRDQSPQLTEINLSEALIS